MNERTGPLQDITIIDCTMALAGPFGSALLADLGADVIKVEPPDGDMSRTVPPRPPDYANPGEAPGGGVDFGGMFASINRNKRSIVLDLKTEAGREVLLNMCEQADAILENTRAGVMDRLGVGYDAVKARNPAIVYGCVRGFGDPRTGESPYTGRPAFDIVAQAMGGLISITGPEDGTGYPCGVSMGDIYPGTLMALGLVAAVHNARRTGEGQFFDVAMYDGVLAMAETIMSNFGYNQHVMEPRGVHHPNLSPFGLFPTQDGAVAIASPRPQQWELLCQTMGREDLLDDERTSTVGARVKNREFVEREIAAWTLSKTRTEVVEALADQLPCGPVNTAADIFADPHVRARNMITEFDLPGDNPKVAIVGSPIKFTGTPGGFYRRAPMLGEHTGEILQQFNIKPQDPKRKS